MMQRVRRYEREQAEQAVRSASERLKREGVSVTTVLAEGNPAKEILGAAAEFDADLVVMGSKGLTGLEGFFLGSVARAVAKRSARPVLLARAPQDGLHEVIVATDGSEHATHAVRFAARLPLPEAARRTIVHVVRPYRPFPESLYRENGPLQGGSPWDGYHESVADVRRKQEGIGASIVAAASASMTAAGALTNAPGTELRVGEPATEILALARERNADLIVAGARGASFMEGLLMGSVADRLLRHARCSVLIVH
jgi:nucleotide-binding universal stress UspA family protein